MPVAVAKASGHHPKEQLWLVRWGVPQPPGPSSLGIPPAAAAGPSVRKHCNAEAAQ